MRTVTLQTRFQRYKMKETNMFQKIVKAILIGFFLLFALLAAIPAFIAIVCLGLYEKI